MAHLISFDTPPSSSQYEVIATGTVAGWSTAHVMVTLTVSGTNLARGTTQHVFYREQNYDNSATSSVALINGTIRVAITPKLHGTETVATDVHFGY